MKSIAVSSGISALLGITEPAMFGVNLKMKYPFYAAMFGSAVGCAYVTLTNVQNIYREQQESSDSYASSPAEC